jgi:hypothetical protein
VLADEEDLGRRLAHPSPPEQRKLAILEGKAPDEIITGQERKFKQRASSFRRKDSVRSTE